MSDYNDFSEQTVLEKVVRLQDGLVARSTGGTFDGGDPVYQRLRSEVLLHPDLNSKIPEFVRRYRDLAQFWQFIKSQYATYAERRDFLWNSFRPAIEHLEITDRNPGVSPIGLALEEFDPDTVHAVWQKALDRLAGDPDGAITSARSLLEAVCKHILDDSGTHYPECADLQKLWALCAEALNLAPSQHQEQLFKSVLGNCQSIVNNIAAIRNRIGDAHGKSRRQVKPKPRHAELVVNLAGTMSAFLIATWKERHNVE